MELMDKILSNKNMYFQDSVGNYILQGDLVRMLHFSTSKKKYYMYKTVLGYVQNDRDVPIKVEFKHFDTDGTFRLPPSEIEENMVIVNRLKFHNDYRLDELKRSKTLRD